PCKEACPAGVDVPRYLRFIVAGQYAEALAVIRESIPFPSVCGYVCPAPCEIKCQLGQVADAPEAIRALKRFVADHASKQSLGNHGGLPKASSALCFPLTGKSVAIVGSGPAGLTAAYYLARQGHKPTVFEALPRLGGMMRVGIPSYRLPRHILDAEIEEINKAGIEVKTSTRIESLDSLFAQGYDAVFLALGAHRGVRMGIDGEETPGVIDALTFLRQVNLGKCPTLDGKAVVVVGGGNSAVDASRTAFRLGAKEVTIVYRRTRAEMRAYPEEIKQAIQEGVNILFLTTPGRIIAEDGRLGIECLRTRSGIKAADGLPPPVKGSEFTVNADILIMAIGQDPEIPPGFYPLGDTLRLPLGTPCDEVSPKTIQIASDTMETARTGVFAGADCVTGSSSVIEAITAGKRAAIAIDRYLGGRGVIAERLAPLADVVVTPVETDYPSPTAIGNAIPLLALTDRLNCFSVVELSLSPEIAVQEAKRCLKCDLPIVVEETKCASCFICQLVCSLRFEGAFDTSKAAIRILPHPPGDANIRISFDDKCDGCGLCVRYCPFGALSRNP
ncbi:MAG: FAD-dependent oxidoreductase, partial [Deltaproteobacteria bacterium]